MGISPCGFESHLAHKINLMNLKDKIVVITGGSKGLGKALAENFIKEGSKVIISSYSKKELESVARKISAIPFVADVTDEKQIIKLANFAVRRFGRIDIWINNAGIWIPHAPIEKLDSKRVREMIEVNLFGTIFGSRVALIQMKKQHRGVIVNVLSTSALEGRAGSAAYCASKYGATGFTKSIRLEAKPERILVLSVYPGGMQTHLFDKKKPVDFDKYMEPSLVAQKVIKNLKTKNPKEELIIKRKK